MACLQNLVHSQAMFNRDDALFMFLKIWPLVGHRVGQRVGNGQAIGLPLASTFVLQFA